MAYTIGENREQLTLMPLCLDDYIGEDSVCRVIDAYVNSLDLAIHLTALGVILLTYRRLLVQYARHFQEVDRTKAHAV
jgi:hypothetical protein